MTFRGSSITQQAMARAADAVHRKLAPPHWEFETIVPKSLLALSLAQQLPKLVRVNAPAGYGKTVFLAEMYRVQVSRKRRCLWVSLDDRDTTVEALAYHLSAALESEQSIRRHGAEQIDSMQGGPMSVAAVLAKLARVDDSLILFIDNLQHCTDVQLRTFLDELAFATPSALRVILASTTTLPIDTARTRLELRDLELGREQLRFEAGDTERLFLAAGGRVPGPTALALIQAQTEGWPAAVRLLQVLVAEGWSDTEVCQSLSGRDHDVAGMLLARMLDGFEPLLVRLLQELALLREFSPELAAHATGDAQAAAWLAQLLERNALVFPLDHGHQWLRMHALLRQHLLIQGRRILSGARRRYVLERAAQWHADCGDLATAIDIAVEAGVMRQQACGWIDQVSRLMVGEQGRFSVYIRWIELLLNAQAPVSLSAQVWYAWSLCFSLQYERARGAVAAIDLRLASAEKDAGDVAIDELDMRRNMMRVVIGVNLDEFDDARRESSLWLMRYAGRDALALATVATGAGLAELATGALDDAQQYLDQARGAAGRSDSPYAHAWVAAVRACLHLQRGEPRIALQLLDSQRSVVAEGVGPNSSAVAVMECVRAGALMDLGLQEEAQAAARAGLRGAAVHGVVDVVAQGLRGAAASPAFDADDLDAVANAYPQRLGKILCAMRVRALLCCSKIAEARSQARRGGLHAYPEGREEDRVAAHGGDVLLAQLELAAVESGTGESARVWRLVAQEMRLAESQGRGRDVVELHLLASCLWSRQGEQRKALRHLSMAVSKGALHQLMGPFIARALQLKPLLAQVRVKDLGFCRQEELILLERLRAAAGIGAEALPMIIEAPLGALTPKEAEILEWLRQGLNNHQIADRSACSTETVKWHLKNLYAKLGVKSRSAALIRAHQLSLLAN